jgi:signal transduction histidine kinase
LTADADPDSGSSVEAGGAVSDTAAPAGLRHAPLAELWLGCYERLVAAAAHEVNNASNGTAMNLEVVRLRARTGADGGAAAPFAAAAIAEHDSALALVGALVALGRSPRGGATDVAEVIGHVATLHAAIARHRGVVLAVTGTEAVVATAAAARAVRLAICGAVEAAVAALGGRPGRDPGEPPVVLRCTLTVTDRPSVVVAPAPAAWPDDPTRAALAAAGVTLTLARDGVRVAFIPA